MSLGVQVSDIKKPLAAEWSIADKGNMAESGPSTDENLGHYVKSGGRVPMVRKGRSYVFYAEFMIPEGST